MKQEEDRSYKSVTCKEAVELLNAGKVSKVWFRPNGIITYQDPDNDMAFVWLKE